MITFSSFTDTGNREINEDAIAVFEKDNEKCFVLCDGLGGHGQGEVASALAVETVGKIFSDSPAKGEELLDLAFTEAQNRIMEEQVRRSAKMDMKTTAVCLHISDGMFSYGHIGDSRLYRFRKNKLVKRTLDHSVPQMLVLAGDIKENQIRNHPDRNRLMRVMGIKWDKKMYVLSKAETLHKETSFLLCSDGFWELIEEKTMCGLLKSSRTVEEWLAAMTQVVKENGRDRNMDNFSAIAVWCR